MALFRFKVPEIVAVFPLPLNTIPIVLLFVIFPVKFTVVLLAMLSAVVALDKVMVVLAVEAGVNVTAVLVVLTVILPNETIGTLVTLILPPVLKVTASPPAGPPANLKAPSPPLCDCGALPLVIDMGVKP